MPKNYKIYTMVASLVISCGIVGSALIIDARRPKTNVRAESSHAEPVTAAQLAQADGKNGHRCYVAVDGTVYEISGLPHWQNGSHTTSQGAAYCGADMTKAIDQSPHGRIMLNQLDIIGPLKN